MNEPSFRDDTRIGEQSSLRTSRGRIWLIVGAIMAVACGGLLLALSTRQPITGVVGASIVVAIYVLMVVATIVIRRTRARLVTLAVLLCAMAAVALGFVLAISAAEWSVLG